MPSALRRPRPLRPGDRVAVLTASSPVGRDPLDAALTVLRDAGLVPVVSESACDAGTFRPFLAGTDLLRADDLTRALLDPSIAAVLFARGGSGAQRTLDALDPARFRDLPPTLLAGSSDVTAVLEAVAVDPGWASLHAPMLAGAAADEVATAALLDALFGRGPDVLNGTDTVVPGRARGTTLGGNLTVLAASVGTPTSRPARGAILLLEDVDEPAYRVDRLLTQLLRSGYLDGVAGLVLGTWHSCTPADVVRDVLAERLGGLGVPVLAGLPVGHGPASRVWPIGVPADLDADGRTVRFAHPATA